MLILPQSQMFREPRLLVPGMPPLGNVKVDWSNPITKNLAAYYIAKPFGFYDAVTGTTTAFPVLTRQTPKGLCVTPTQTAELTVRDFGNSSVWGNHSTVLQVNLIASVNYAAASYITSFLGYWYYDTSQHFIRITDQYIGLSSSYSGKVVGVCTANEYVAYGSSKGWAYVNGLYVGGTSIGSGAMSTCQWRMNDRSANDTGGAVMAFWKRTLQHSVCASLSADPYQFLIPA
jgi:hypothetical protein